MIECEELGDRMPDVAHGRATWSLAELEHLDSCTKCRGEWELVQSAVALASDQEYALHHVASTALARLRAESRVAPVRRLPWRAGVVGVLAIAATILLVLGLRQQRPPAIAGARVESVAIVPGLHGLDDSDLVTVLQSMGPSAADAAPGLVPHLEDLTDSELEQLLRSEEGE